MKALIAATTIILTAGANAQTTAQQIQPAPATSIPQAEGRIIIVSLEDRKLALVKNGTTLKTYTVAVGKPSTPSPEGDFTIVRRVANPTYQHNGKTIPAGPGNPVGTRWMGLSKSGYGIHGTNEPNSIGKAASHGCIRMAQADLEEFYKLISVGDTVEIIGHRNQETMALFNPAPTPVTAPATAIQASSEAPAGTGATPVLNPAALIPTAMLTATEMR